MESDSPAGRRARAAAPCIMPLYSTVLLRLIRLVGLNAQPVERLMSGYRFAPGQWPGPERLWLSTSFFLLGLLFPSARAGWGQGAPRTDLRNYPIHRAAELFTQAPPPIPSPRAELVGAPAGNLGRPKGSVANPCPQQAKQTSYPQNAKSLSPTPIFPSQATYRLVLLSMARGSRGSSSKRPPRSSR